MKLRCPKCSSEDVHVSYYKRKWIGFCNEFLCGYFSKYNLKKDLNKEWCNSGQ